MSPLTLIYVDQRIIWKPFLKNSISTTHAQKYCAYLIKYLSRV